MDWHKIDERRRQNDLRKQRISDGQHPRWDGAVVLKIGGWEKDRFVVDSDHVQGYIDSGEFVVRPFKYIQE